ncbi:MAG: ABC transporter ATP-binding protein [Limisphaerales bacterium]|jgi:ATP-binding cassette subfamily B protein
MKRGAPHVRGVRSARGAAGGDFSARKRSTWEVIRRVGVYLRPYKFLAFANIGCAILSLAFAFAFPKLTQVMIDDVITPGRADLVWPAALALLGAFLFRDLFNSLRIRLNNHFEQNVIFDLRRDVYERLQRLPAGYFDHRASGDLMTRVVEDVNSVERVLIDGTEQGTVAILSVVGVMLVLWWQSPVLAGIALVPIPFLLGGAFWYTTTAHTRYRAQREASSAMNALLLDNLQGVRQIKAFHAEEQEDVRFAETADALRKGTLKVMLAWANYSPAMSFFTACGTVLVLGFGGSQVLQGAMTLGEMVSFLFYLGLFYEPLSRLHGLNQMMQAARAAGERVFDILDAETEERPERRKRQFEGRARGRVVYEHVAFGYSDERVVLEDIELVAEPGDVVALVGPTGAGKSTLVHLLPAFYEATRGRILIDGEDVAGVRLESLRSQIAMVSQEPFLFNGTIRENIVYGCPGADGEAVERAAKAANAHEFIARLPEGYDSRVGERGIRLSVGEKQRISIARALLKDAPILILDEATASVDTATERMIQEALERLMRGRTSFVIAHRLSTIRRANQILVLRHGRIEERGTHEELMRAGGLYARLASIQNTTFVEEGFERIGSEQARQ